MYTFAKMTEIAAFTATGTASLCVIITLSAWSWVRDRAAYTASAAYEKKCAKAGCAHNHALAYVPEPPPAGLPADCPFHCSPDCDAGEWHCADYHLPASQRSHDPRSCPGGAITVTLPAVRDSKPGAWAGIDAEIDRITAWAERLAAG